MRKLVENLSSKALAERCAELIAAARDADPLLSRRDRLERAIKDSEK